MAEIAKYGMTPWGGDGLANVIRQAAVNGTPTTFAMAALNTGWAARFLAPAAKIVKGFRVYWGTITAPGEITARLEGVDANGDPDGTLIDANATRVFTPTAGAQLVEFAVDPTTALTPGTMYALVLLTTTAGTAHTLRSYFSGSGAPQAALHAADGTTRANFAEAAAGVYPVTVFTFTDGTEEACGCCPFYESSSASSSSRTLYGASRRAGALIEVPTITTARGLHALISKTGTPAGPLLVELQDKNGSTVSGTSKSFAPGLIGGARILRVLFTGTVELTAELSPYRVVLQSPASVAATDCFTAFGAKAFSSKHVASGHIWTWYDGTWHDEPTIQAGAELLLDTIVPAAGGGSAILRPGCSLGGVNG